VLDQTVNELLSEAQRLCEKGCEAPDELGYPLLNENGDELSMGELVWIERRLAVLSNEYASDIDLWRKQEWQVVIALVDWSEVVIEAMDLANGENR